MNDAVLAKVKAKYRANLAHKAANIERLANEIAHDTERAELAAALHQLAGSAGFYGEIKLSDTARDLEYRVLKSNPLDSELRMDLGALLARMRES